MPLPPLPTDPARSLEEKRRLLAALKDVVEALDKRQPQPGRPAERAIAADASALRGEALRRIGLLERDEPSR